MNIVQVLYPGLGGHGSVAFGLIDGSPNPREFSMIFYGIEPVIEEYKEKCVRYHIPYRSILKKQGIDFSSYRNLFQVLRELDPQVIILHSVTLLIPVWLFCKWKSRQFIFVEHQSNRHKRKSEWLWTRLSQHLATKIVYLTDLYKEEVNQHLNGHLAHTKIAVIPNGIPSTFFLSTTTTKKRPNKEGLVHLFMMSRFTPLRDHSTLIRAFDQLCRNNPQRHLQLSLAGTGETLEAAKDLSKQLAMKDKICFTGLLNENELIAYLQKVDIYIHSSLAETMSTALMQVMAQGIPIIATDIPGINNMIEHRKTGLIFAPGDIKELVELVELFIKEADFANLIGEQGREQAYSLYTPQLMYQRYKSLFS